MADRPNLRGHLRVRLVGPGLAGEPAHEAERRHTLSPEAQRMRQTISHWIPAAFCAIVSLIALFALTGSNAGWFRPTFFAFLPLCFVFVGAATF